MADKKRSTGKSKLSAVFIALAIALPLYETVLYYSFVTRNNLGLSGNEIIKFVSLTIMGYLLILISIILDKERLKKTLKPVITKLDTFKKRIWQSLSLLLFLIPLLFLVFIFIKRVPNSLKNLFTSKKLEALILILIWFFITFLSYFISKILRLLVQDKHNLYGAMTNWSFSILMSLPFYILLTFVSWYLIKPANLNTIDLKFSYYLGFTKDLMLIWIISEILYLSIYKLVIAERLYEVFRSIRGFLQFIVVCGIIAILAIWADFNFLVSKNMKEIYHDPLQQNITAVHIFVRDIFLLLFPISVLLIWALRHLSYEISKNKVRKGSSNKTSVKQ